jgi:hypothetical protein
VDTEREWYRKARVARFHLESWRDFRAANRGQIIADFPVRKERATMIDAIQQIVLTGVGGPVQTLSDSLPGVRRASELGARL